MGYTFDVKKVTEECISWIRDWFSHNGNENTCAVIGISGGKDSTVVARLLVEALGAERVIGVLIPNGEQKDISDSFKVCDTIGIERHVVNIGKAYEALTDSIKSSLGLDTTPMYSTNTPARLRMATLYGVGAMYGNCRVVNTCNLSEDTVGYSTFFGDSCGDFAPVRYLTTEEVVAIGDYLGLPYPLVHKSPSDGMCGKTDEDNLGFTYHEVNEYIRRGVKGEHFEEINRKFLCNKFKTSVINIEGYRPQNLENNFEN